MLLVQIIIRVLVGFFESQGGWIRTGGLKRPGLAD